MFPGRFGVSDYAQTTITMELNQYEGLSPFQDFYHDGSSGFASFLTYDASLLPAAMTVSSVLVRLDDKLHAPHGMKKHTAYTDKYAPLMKANGDRGDGIERTERDQAHRRGGGKGTEMWQAQWAGSLRDKQKDVQGRPCEKA